MFLIDDTTAADALFPATHARGYEPGAYTPGLFASAPAELTLIPRSEWDARIQEQEERKSSLWHIRQAMNQGKPHVSLDQNGQGFCWAYSTGHSIMYARGRDNQPYHRLSPHAVACKIKGFRDEGGWCGLSMKFAAENGYPTVGEWPEKSMSRQYDTAATWEAAKRQRVTENVFDLSRAVYDQEMSFDAVATCLLLNIPCPVDFNWWSHSVCAIQLVRVEAGSYGLRIQNSWTDGWGEQGCAVLRGQRAVPDNAVATLVATAAA